MNVHYRTSTERVLIIYGPTIQSNEVGIRGMVSRGCRNQCALSKIVTRNPNKITQIQEIKIRRNASHIRRHQMYVPLCFCFSFSTRNTLRQQKFLLVWFNPEKKIHVFRTPLFHSSRIPLLYPDKCEISQLVCLGRIFSERISLRRNILLLNLSSSRNPTNSMLYRRTHQHTLSRLSNSATYSDLILGW